MAKRPKVTTDASPLTSNPFASLLPEGEALPAEPAEPAEPIMTEPAELDGRLIVRRQKKGQGGKTVTCVEGLSEAALEALLPRLKRDLGCSGRVDGSMLVAGTGDHHRVAKWLRAAGAPKVLLGN
jgi:translation initiation factor 1